MHALPTWHVEEIQGLYGPFTFSEKLLQRIWAESDYDARHLTTTDGRPLRIVHPGRWNLLGGPDFKEARIQCGADAVRTCDVELHLRAEDWRAHGHAADAAYDGVGLHVVLFPPKRDHVTVGAGGHPLPVVALLPWLHHDLEEYAAEEAVEALANQPAARVVELIRRLSPEGGREELQGQARRRWEQKVTYAARRIARLGWSAACHHAGLEILGYRFNRIPMLRLAQSRPLAAWRGLSDERLDDLFVTESRWSLAGVRPANHPRRRLAQYQRWVAARPAWPADLLALAAEWPQPAATADTPSVRRVHGLGAWRDRVAADVCGGAVGGTRFDTLLCDGFMPLLAAQAGTPLDGCWHHWFAGDVPDRISAALRQVGVFDGRRHPACHGPVQGLLGWMFAQAE